MATKKIRLEKKDGKQTLYTEFQFISGNSVMRVWNKVTKLGIHTTLKDRENFQSPDDVATYIKNQKAALEKDGWVLAGNQPATTAATPTANDLE